MVNDKKFVACTLLLLSGLILLGSLSESYSIGPNYHNVSIDVTVNVTNSRPEVLLVEPITPVTLTAGSTYAFECNTSLRDYNGGNTIDSVNASLFHSSSSVFAADDNNSHYTNSSCLQTSVSGFYANYTCTFDVYYYANDGTWNCSVFVNDTFGFTNNGTNTSSIQELYALNVTPLIDYGDLAVGDTSSNETANVTNLGNVLIAVSVYGYGATPGDGLAMVCDQNNISIANQKYSADIADDFVTKTSLSGSAINIPGFTLAKQTTPGSVVTNETYWQVYLSASENPFGICNGTVVFQAEVNI